MRGGFEPAYLPLALSRRLVRHLGSVTSHTKEILNDSVHRKKPLRMRGGFEPAYLPLALSRRLGGDGDASLGEQIFRISKAQAETMRHLGSIVLVLPGAVDHGRHHGTVRRCVAAQLVRDQTPRLSMPCPFCSRSAPCASRTFNSLRKNPSGRPAIASRLDQDVDHVTVLVHGAPQILLPALDRHEELVQIPHRSYAQTCP